MTVQTIDTDYLDQPGVAAAYLVVEGGGKWGYDEDLRAYVDAVLVP